MFNAITKEKYSLTRYVGNDINVVIPSEINNIKVTVIGSNAFSSMNIKNINIPDSVIEIEYGAFYLTNLKHEIKKVIERRFGLNVFYDGGR